MMKKYIYIFTICSGMLLFNSGCSKDDHPEPVHEEELITTVKVILTPKNGGKTITLISKDIDADGPKKPTITGGNLKKGTTYTGAITLLNETEDPVEDVTEEIEEEPEEHQFFYEAKDIGCKFKYTGKTDKNGKPIGLSFEVATGDTAGSGNYTITLRHKPNKSATGVSTGDMTNAGGETDIEVVFPITLE